LIADHHNRRRREPAALGEKIEEPAIVCTAEEELDRAFAENWRDELLARAWTNLAEVEQTTGQPFYSVLRFRADHPESRSPDLATRQSEQLGKPLTATGVRQLLHRARERFAEFILDDVAQSLGSAAPASLQEELVELGLLAYCRPAMERRS
jgi:RNA polymerase sigma-70 factor (ECF subfamily)